MSYTREQFKEEAKQGIIDFLADGYDGYLSDIHNEIFNMELYTEDTAEATEMLDEMGGYSVVAECLEYEQDNFGQVSAEKYSNPVWVLSMFWYIIGEEALAELMDGVPEADELWNEEMTDIDCKVLLARFKEKMEE